MSMRYIYAFSNYISWSLYLCLCADPGGELELWLQWQHQVPSIYNENTLKVFFSETVGVII